MNFVDGPSCDRVRSECDLSCFCVRHLGQADRTDAALKCLVIFPAPLVAYICFEKTALQPTKDTRL